MKKAKILARILAAALLFALILPVHADAINSTYTTNRVPVSVGGINYEMWTSLYQDTATEFRGATWVSTANYAYVPTGHMGVRCILYKSKGEAYVRGDPQYNPCPDYFQFAMAPTVVADSSGIYAGGEVYLYTDSGYQTVRAPETVCVYPSAKAASASDDGSALMDELKATLDENNEYPVTASGKTYGSELLASVVGHKPDLILAEGEDGVVGYVRASDFEPDVNNPEEAMAYMAELENCTEKYRVIPLYDLEENIIGSFHVMIPDLHEEIPAQIQATIDQLKARKDWPRNSAGEPYGFDYQVEAAKAIGIELDLRAAVGIGGQSGYMRMSDTIWGQFTINTPEDAMRYMAYLYTQPEEYFIPLYDLEGNVIDQFRMYNGCSLSDEEISRQLRRK